MLRKIWKTMGYFVCLVSLIWLVLSAPVYAGEVSTTMPDQITPGDKYVFYVHGGKYDKTNKIPNHAVFGKYNLEGIKQALQDPTYHLIAMPRPSKMKKIEASAQLASNVEQLILNGVNPKDISLVGFSSGAIIVILAASKLEKNQLNLVLLAGCAGVVMWDNNLKVWGHVLSLYDKEDDFVSSCAVLKSRGDGVTSFAETVLNSGKGHGVFFNPAPQWVDPVKNWIKTDHTK